MGKRLSLYHFFFTAIKLIGTLSFCNLVIAPPKPSLKPTPKCQLTLAEAPVLRGIKLGMTPQQVSSILPQKLNIRGTERNQTFGISSENTELKEVGIKYNNFGLDGITNVYMVFRDNQLALLEMTYDDTKFESLDAFVYNLTGALHLPGGWERDSYGEQTLNCVGFKIEATLHGGRYYNASLGLPKVVVKNEAPFLAAEERLRKAIEDEELEKKRIEEKKRRAFRP